MPSALIGKNQLYYEIEGKGESLILIAGYGCDLSSWEAVRKPLAEHFQLVMLDNRGMGRSECWEDSYTVDDMVHDVLELAEKLKLNKPHVLGHSMGGSVSQTIAYKYPEQVGKTIIAQSFTKLKVAARAALLGFLNLREEGVSFASSTRTVLPWLVSDGWLENPQLCELFIQLQSKEPVPEIAELIKQHKALSLFDSQAWCSKITTKPLILAGSEDRISPIKDIETMATCIPHSAFHIFQKTGHIAHLENPQEFCEVVLSYLKK